MIYERKLTKIINKYIYKGKVIILYGARQVGKTTFVKQFARNHSKDYFYMNCDDFKFRQLLENKGIDEISDLLKDQKLVVIDEAQRVENIGLTLKIIVDNLPNVQVIATGSSSFSLSNKILEPLTGRSFEFEMYPLSINELLKYQNNFDIKNTLEKVLIFGLYPEIYNSSKTIAIKLLENIVNNYLYKDILEFQGLKKSDLIIKLLQALALQIGNEVSYNELASIIGTTKETVSNYINLLEQSYIIFRLNPLSRNLRKEIGKMRKIYFYDLGVRNMLINNLNPINLRNDIGQLWENFCVVERMKRNSHREYRVNKYFWRTSDQKELDYVEEKGGSFTAFEFKFRKSKLTKPQIFLDTYPSSKIKLINSDNFIEFCK